MRKLKLILALLLVKSPEWLAALADKFDLPGPQMVRKSDMPMPGANGRPPARLYDAETAGDTTPCPTLLYLHGGGWVQGGLDTHDGLCAKMAAWVGIRAISYVYRLAPEYKFPAGLDDCLACYSALVETPSEWGADARRAGADLFGGVYAYGFAFDGGIEGRLCAAG